MGVCLTSTPTSSAATEGIPCLCLQDQDGMGGPGRLLFIFQAENISRILFPENVDCFLNETKGFACTASCNLHPNNNPGGRISLSTPYRRGNGLRE